MSYYAPDWLAYRIRRRLSIYLGTGWLRPYYWAGLKRHEFTEQLPTPQPGKTVTSIGRRPMSLPKVSLRVGCIVISTWLEVEYIDLRGGNKHEDDDDEER